MAADLRMATPHHKPLCTPRGDTPGGVALAAGLFGVAALLGLWAVLSYGGFTDPVFFPSPTAVAAAFWKSLIDGRLLEHIWASLNVINIGFLALSLIAIPLGLMMGTFKVVLAAFEPIINFMRYLPVTAMIPLLNLWVGIGIEQKITVIFIGTVFQQVVMVGGYRQPGAQRMAERGQHLWGHAVANNDPRVDPRDAAGADGHAARHHGLGLDISGGG